MTDRLTPPMLLDLAEIDERIFGETPWSRALRREAARREAEARHPSHETDEIAARSGLMGTRAYPHPMGPIHDLAKELGRDRTGALGSPTGEREGPDSAAAPNAWRRECPHSNVMCESPVCREYGCQAVRGEAAIVPEDKPAPADDLVKRLRGAITKSNGVDASAGLIGYAADFVEAQAWEIAEVKSRYLEVRRGWGDSEARVRDLEAETKLNGELVDSAQEHARNAHVKYLAEKARADRLAANKAVLIEALKLCRELADHIAKAPLPLFRAQATKVRECIDAALTEGGA